MRQKNSFMVVCVAAFVGLSVAVFAASAFSWMGACEGAVCDADGQSKDAITYPIVTADIFSDTKDFIEENIPDVPDPAKVFENAKKAFAKAAEDVRKTADKARKDSEAAASKVVDDFVSTGNKAAKDVGNAGTKADQDARRTVQKAALDSGKAIEKGVHDTGKAVEEAGKDIEKFFKEVFKFHLSCDLPSQKPAILPQAYREHCSRKFKTYQNDIDNCNQAGGVSVASSDAAGAGGTVTGGLASLAVAKAAFELCERACQSKVDLEVCQIEVDKGAIDAAVKADEAESANAEKEEFVRRAQCAHEGYTGETEVALSRIAQACEKEDKCDTESENFKRSFIDEASAVIAEIRARRVKSVETILSGGRQREDYGSFIEDKLDTMDLSFPDETDHLVCWAWKPDVALKASAASGGLSAARVDWIYARQVMFSTPMTIGSDGKVLTANADLTDRHQGKWQARIVSGTNEILGTYGFLFWPEATKPMALTP